MSTARTALLVGATGLTGKHLLTLLLAQEDYSEVVILTRAATGIVHSRLREIVMVYDDWNKAIPAHDVFCCLGTTMKKAKTKESFRKVDHDYPVKIARLQREAGSQKFIVVSAAGSSAGSPIFYSRVKGQMEAALEKMNYPQLTILRPGLIIGNRQEKRAGEKIAELFFRLIGPLLAGPFGKYRPVTALAVARAMLSEALNGVPGNRVIDSEKIKSFE